MGKKDILVKNLCLTATIWKSSFFSFISNNKSLGVKDLMFRLRNMTKKFHRFSLLFCDLFQTSLESLKIQHDRGIQQGCRILGPTKMVAKHIQPIHFDIILCDKTLLDCALTQLWLYKLILNDANLNKLRKASQRRAPAGKDVDLFNIVNRWGLTT